ncbi:MAG: hypothetical protein ACI837_003053 [Crocinitomicaceae bacterium]|jgi:hypothetical protein
MKKVIGIAAFAVLGVVALSSCKKEYTCTCVDSTLTVTTETNKGSDATDACDDLSSLIPLKACTPA